VGLSKHLGETKGNPTEGEKEGKCLKESRKGRFPIGLIEIGGKSEGGKGETVERERLREKT